MRKMLSENFGLSFDASCDPVCDESFHSYVLELDDATKVLFNESGEPLNFGSMDIETFMTVRNFIDNDEIERVLDL